MIFWWKKKKQLDDQNAPLPIANKKKPNSQKIDNKVILQNFQRELYVWKKNNAHSHYLLDPKDMKTFKIVAAMNPKDRGSFLVAYAQNPPIAKEHMTLGWARSSFIINTFAKLIRRKADLSPEQIAIILTSIQKNNISQFEYWSIGLIINQLEKNLKKHDLSESSIKTFKKIAEWPEFKEKTYYGSSVQKARVKLLTLVAADDPGIMAYPLTGNSNICDSMAQDLDSMDVVIRNEWNLIFIAAAQAKGARPTKKFLTEIKEKIDNLGISLFKEQTRTWIARASMADSFLHKSTTDHYDAGRLNGLSQDLLKGLVWGMARFHDEKSLSAIARLAEKCFERLPGIGPAAPALGNACIYTLANSKGLSGVAHLSRLKMRVKQNNTQKLIQKNIEEQAAKLGLKSTEIEDMAAPDFGLELGIKTLKFKDYTLQLNATQTGQAVLSWIKPDGKSQKSVPSFIKGSAPLMQKLKDIRAQAKDIKKASTAQRDRIDRLYTEDMSWTPEAFGKYYLDHGLIGPMARKLIWSLTINGKAKPGLFTDGIWQDQNGKAIKGTPEKFQLWHPIMSKAADILVWRARLETLEIKQPFKQTFREVYLLTDAEINTKVYSNRMAAHILKQHQFNSLAAIRGWKYTLMGAYDDGRDNEVAQKPLPAYGLVAEFWIDELMDEADSFNDSGIWDYVATDQVRFTDTHNQTIDLIDIPPIILSEILRDTDLFVGVASVGNDPTWADRDGAPRARDYWQSYSFGDLSETAKTRKTVLENLLPRLKIRDKAKIDGKFLIVQGTRHSYKIHIGSGNILIMPNDRYLCIVPGRGKNKDIDTLYLPFEGDRGLSIVLSKAFMLVADDKITDRTILSQL